MKIFMSRIERRVLCARVTAALGLLMVLCTPGHAQTVEYIHTDSLGSPVAVTDAGRNVIERSEYAPYGDLLNRPDTDGPGYAGQVRDTYTGMSYMQQRYYDSQLGRFLSVDPISARSGSKAFNRYWYANNNTYRFVDPDGRAADDSENRRRVQSDSASQPAKEIQKLREINVHVDPGRNGTQQMTREFELTNPSPNGGYVIQKMTTKVEITKPEKITSSLTYYEAFEVPQGAVGTVPSRDTFAVSPPAGSSGSASWSGSARFYENLTLPSTFSANGVRNAGSLPATTVDPKLDPRGATAPVNVEFKTSWP